MLKRPDSAGGAFTLRKMYPNSMQVLLPIAGLGITSSLYFLATVFVH